jgi:integrase
MASLIFVKARTGAGKSGWRIQFMDGDGRRRSVYLGAVPKKVAKAWVSRVEEMVSCSLTGVAWDSELAAWIGGLPDMAYGKLAHAGLVAPRESPESATHTMAQLTAAFVARSSGKPATIRGFQQTLDSLKNFFGDDVVVESITAEDADRWRAWVVQDTEGSGRRKKRRTTVDNRLSPPTVAKRVSVAKQVFRTAVRWGWISKSPFDGLRPGSQANPARARYVPLETIQTVLDACPSLEWQLLIALARYAGLRCPSEFIGLTWGDVNWEKGRLTVRSTKTEHHGGDHAVRVVPICPELRVILAEAFERAEPGESLIVPMAARTTVNLRTHFERIITKAGREPWPRLFQNLRASCETDWVEKYPSHVVAKWLGHSPKVAAQHYLMSREHHFEDVVRGSGDAASRLNSGQGSMAGSGCGAECCAPRVQNAVQQASALDGTESHETTEPAAATRVTAGSSEVTPVLKTGKMAGTGFEPATSRL